MKTLGIGIAALAAMALTLAACVADLEDDVQGDMVLHQLDLVHDGPGGAPACTFVDEVSAEFEADLRENYIETGESQKYSYVDDEGNTVTVDSGTFVHEETGQEVVINCSGRCGDQDCPSISSGCERQGYTCSSCSCGWWCDGCFCTRTVAIVDAADAVAEPKTN